MVVAVPIALGQTPARPARVHSALNDGISCYRRADYEAAASFFLQAQAGQEDLSADEQQELNDFIRLNTSALKARREGAEQLRQAERYVATGRTADADALLKSVTTNQFLTPADKLKAQKLANELRQGSYVRGSTKPDSGVSSATQARVKVKQARAELAKANYESAETLAKEADQLKVSYNAGEDNPRKLLDDLARLQSDPKSLLVSGRVALQNGDLDGAEKLAHAADHAAKPWTFRIWGDNPSKLLRDIQTARMQSPTISERRSAKNPKDSQTLTPAEASRQLLKDGRAALRRGDYAEAKNLAEQAKSLNADYHWWEDSPTKLLSDIQRMSERSKRGSMRDKDKSQTPSFLSSPPATASTDEDPHAQLRMARELCNADKLNESEKIARNLQSNPDVSWGLFEDTPDHVLSDIRKAKAKHEHEESLRLMVEARQHYERGEFEAARSSAQKADKLHGPYSIWEMGERPSKLLAELDAAQAKNRKGARSSEALARKDGATDSSTSKSAVASATNAASPKPPSSSTGITLASATEPAASSSASPTPGKPPSALGSSYHPLPSASADASKDRAVRLLAEARRAQKEGRLVEARQKALEAQKTGVNFGADEDRPERCLLQLASLANRRIEFLLQEATDYAATASGDATRYKKAEADLVQANQLATGFAFDTQAIDLKLSWVKRLEGQPAVGSPAETSSSLAKMPPPAPSMMPAPAPVASTTPPPARQSLRDSVKPTTQETGMAMLANARAELYRGELDTARRIAVEVYNGPYGLQSQADAILHSIDAEEANMRQSTANRSFDVGVAAYYRRDFTQAATIFRGIDAAMLSPEKQIKLKELMQTSELQPRALTQTAGQKPSPFGAADAGRAAATDFAASGGSAGDSYAQQVQAMQEIQFQKLRDEGLRVQREASDRYRNGDADQALEMLQAYLDSLKDTQLEASKVALLQRPVEARLHQFKQLRTQQAFDRQQAGQHDSFVTMKSREARLEEHKQQEVAKLMEQYHNLYKDGKYEEAEMVAMRAKELDPDNAGAAAAANVAHIQRNQVKFDGIKNRREDMTLIQLDEAEDVGPVVNNANPLAFDKDRWAIAKGRKAFPKDGVLVTLKSEKEQEIERRLSLPISLDFKDTPLRQVIDDLRDLTNINIVPDMPALEEENISLDRPVTMHLEGVSTKNALDLLLHQAHLIYVPKNEVLIITTEAHAKGQMIQKTYQVADLIIPVDNHPVPDSQNLQKILEKQSNNQGLVAPGNAPYLGTNSLANGAPVGSMTATPTGTSPSGAPAEAHRAPGQTLEDLLIKMITSTIKPETWDDMGGPGHIEYYPLGMALVISQTPDIQEQVSELLAALRRLQDIEVTVEVRFITISEAFFERIGLDFNINVLTDNTKVEPQIIAQQFQPFGFNNDFSPSSFVTGLQPGLSPPGVFTPDLNIPIRSTSFGPAVPPFGGFPNNPLGDGGISLGLAFLSDIQVFLFLEAAQGDRRTNVMQAPKLTLFNGQNSNIAINNQQFFVTSVTAGAANGQVFFVPNNTALNTGVTLNVQAVVSADRRFVRLNLAPQLSNISSPVTALFPVTTFITPTFENGTTGPPVPFTQFIQQPSITTVNVNTTVNVPDGGTVLLGGLKTLREGRNEFGPPILSKIPYIDRLFKNVGYGRETESLLLMVTPRVIVNEEEELRQTGVGAQAPGGAAPPP
jgi:type II secretory pathway component GspD/PulD (secretin)